MVSDTALIECLLGRFYYEEGFLKRKFRNRQWPEGKVMGYVDTHGYLVLDLLGKSFRVHRLIFLLHHGYLPKLVDHIDGNRLNNNIYNLRDATSKQNNLNRTAPSKANKLGVLGVSPYKGRFKAQLSCKNLGCFDTAEEAQEVYLNAKLAANERLTTC